MNANHEERNVELELASPRKRALRRLACDDHGLSTVEYIIILVLIAVAGITLWTEFGATVKSKIVMAKDTVEAKVNP